MAGEQKRDNGLEQFIVLAKNVKGPALLALINQVLEAPGVYAFGEFLQLPCIQELSKGPDKGYSQLLNVFAYGTYLDYRKNEDVLPPLTEVQENKLRHLTLVSLAAYMQYIPYAALFRDLGLGSMRKLEDLIIEAVYADVIRGKLDQRGQLLEVDSCIGRDVRSEATGDIADTLRRWCSGCESVSAAIELQVEQVSQSREVHLRVRQLMETEVSNIRRLIMTTQSKEEPSAAKRH